MILWKINIFFQQYLFSEETGGFNISFPDLPGAFTCGEDFEDAMYMAKDCLEVYLHDLDEIPKVSTPNSLSLKEGEFIILIEADLLSFRKKYDRQTIKKTLTIPKWLNDEALNKKINFSAVLKEALIEELHIR